MLTGFLGAAIGVFVRLRKVEAERSAADVRLDHLERNGSSTQAFAKEIGGLKTDLAEFKLEAERRFLARQDWVPVMSQMIAKLEVQGETIARIGEYIRIKGER